MVLACGSDRTKACSDASSFHAESVQNRWLIKSALSAYPSRPFECLSWRAMLIVCLKKPGTAPKLVEGNRDATIK
jgi:hypothetical protein